MIKYGELHQALACYTSEDIHENIPVDTYRRVIKACFRANNIGLNWSVTQGKRSNKSHRRSSEFYLVKVLYTVSN